MPMNRGLLLSVNTFFLYAFTLLIGVAAAFRHVVMPATGTVAQLEPTLGNAIIFVVVFLGFTFLVVRFARFASVALRAFLILALFAGVQFVLAGWLPFWYSVAGGVLLLALLQYVPRVLVHDITLMIGIAGLAGLMGLSITPLLACVLLALLSFYDIVSVYRTRHMVALAGRMISSGNVFGFLVPSDLRKFFMRTSDALEAQEVLMLGSGDIALPLVLAASVVSTSIAGAAMVAVFSLAGVMLMHYLFAHQKDPLPMAALPPIAASAILGFLVATLLHI